MPVYYDKTRKRWRYEFSRLVGGRRRRATKLLPQPWTRAKAEAYARAQDEHLYAVATGAVREQPLISQAVAVYLAEHAQGSKNLDLLERDLALALPWYEGKRMNELPDVARQYAQDKAGTLKPATVKLRMSYLRAACRWAWKNRGMGDHDPAERLTLPTVKNERHRYVERADVLFNCRSITDLDCRAVVLVAFYSGMRLAECLRAEPTERGWLLTDTKNGERRLVPIHRKVAHLARRWPTHAKYREIERWWTWATRANGYKDLRFHDLRHSAASAMINQGIALYTVGAVLGHKAAASTQRYSHLDVSTLTDAVASIGKRR